MKYTAMIDSVGAYVPAKIVNNKDLEKIIETTDEWIRTRTGMWERHYTDSTQAASDLAIKAAENAIYSSNTTRHKDIEMIITGTVTGDHPYPSTSCIVQKKLGLKDIPAFDLAAGCSGFLYAIDVAKRYIESGACSTILVIGVDVLTKVQNWTDRNTCVLFGDGAGAIIIKRSTNNSVSQIVDSKITADGSEWELLVQKAGGSRMPASHETVTNNLHSVYMEGNKVFKHAVRAMAGISTEMLKKNDYTVKDIDWVIPHQANIRIIEAVAEKMHAPIEKVIITVDKYANTSASSIPLAMADAVKDGRIKRGDVVLLTAFGAGLTFAATLIRY
jgi:3-oxoacyl-[acyl-carrier-protein] synthase-3